MRTAKKWKIRDNMKKIYKNLKEEADMRKVKKLPRAGF